MTRTARCLVSSALIGLSILSGACNDADGTPDSPSWGPLAVARTAGGGGDMALGGGVLRVTDECVTLEGRDALLVWPADRTGWNPATRTITFEDSRGETLTLEDGDMILLSGSATSPVEDDTHPDPDWVNPPAESCPAGSRVTIGDVTENPDGAS